MPKHTHRSDAVKLVEVAAAIVMLVVLAAVVLPAFTGTSLRSREVALQSDLRILRNAIWLFQVDCGCYPASLADLAATSAPASGVGSTDERKYINAADWNGPYVASVPNDPISRSAFGYFTSTNSGRTVGELCSSSTGTASDGRAYDTW